jgi:uncharacterized protein with ParB-like and HNH nuclease domain
MEAKAKSFTFLGNEGSVKIPFFQRAYIWDEDNWNDLLSDLLNENKTHFLGSLILKQERSLTGEAKEVLVIDGQQRLTTLSILLKALYDSFSDEIRNNCILPIRTHLFYKKNQTDSRYFVKIQHSHIDSQAYYKVIRGGIDEELFDLTQEPSNKISWCYKHYMFKMAEMSEDMRKKLFNIITNSENKMLVVIDLEKDDNEQAIFDTINSAGVRLTSADIIKNALFQKAIQILEEKEAIKLYNETWCKVFLIDDETSNYWDSEKITGRLKRDNIEILLHCIAVIKGFYDPDKDTLDELSDLYKKEIAKIRNKEELQAFVNDVTEYAKIYKEKIPSFDYSTALSFVDNVQRLFHILEVLQVSTFHPFILYLFKTHEKDRTELNLRLNELEKFVVRRMIAKEETKSYNKLCKEFIANESVLVKKLAETTPEKVSTGLRNIQNNYAALVLFWVELNRRFKDHKYDNNELKYSYTLEHIMPQKWEEYWKDIPDKILHDGTAMNAEDSKKDRYNKVYWIGNMTLLTSKLNTALRNYVFENKMEGEGGKKGIKAYADLSITKEIVSAYDNGRKVWNESDILKRTKAFEVEIESIWGISDLLKAG